MEEELRDILLGRKIGSGSYRDVYDCVLDSSLVVKVERKDGEFHNIKEWNIWDEVKYTELAHWFAPCVSISKNGKILIQKKVEFGLKKDYPTTLPTFFTDIKMSNFGFLDERLVCVDYGSTIVTRTFTDKRKRKVDWF